MAFSAMGTTTYNGLRAAQIKYTAGCFMGALRDLFRVWAQTRPISTGVTGLTATLLGTLPLLPTILTASRIRKNLKIFMELTFRPCIQMGSSNCLTQWHSSSSNLFSRSHLRISPWPICSTLITTRIWRPVELWTKVTMISFTKTFISMERWKTWIGVFGSQNRI